MEEALKNFAQQFAWKPIIEHEDALPRERRSVVLCGMGGSHLAADILKMVRPETDIYIHRDYGLPALDDAKYSTALHIASSHSGNTEEVLDFVSEALKRGRSVAVISSGGALIDVARTHSLPYVLLPDGGIQPRVAIGHALVALGALLGDTPLLQELGRLAVEWKPSEIEAEGKALAWKMQGKIPLVYASRARSALAMNWKIRFNETAKIPAFHNVFPELNHNEMEGFDLMNQMEMSTNIFHFIFLFDKNDHPRISRRMIITRKLLEARGYTVSVVESAEKNPWINAFHLLLLADWTAVHIAQENDVDPEQVPMISELKEKLS